MYGLLGYSFWNELSNRLYFFFLLLLIVAMIEQVVKLLLGFGCMMSWINMMRYLEFDQKYTVWMQLQTLSYHLSYYVAYTIVIVIDIYCINISGISYCVRKRASQCSKVYICIYLSTQRIRYQFISYNSATNTSSIRIRFIVGAFPIFIGYALFGTLYFSTVTERVSKSYHL